MKPPLYSHFLLLGILILLFTSACKTPKTSNTVCIAFYNLENLFDTIDQLDVVDEEFSSGGKKAWTPDRYLEKLDNMSRVIHDIGLNENHPDGAAIIGVCELENAGVMEDLANTEKLKGRNYEFVHYDSPYYRGMDVALFYQPKYFSVISSSSHELNIADNEDYTTRAQLLVTGMLNKDTVHVIVNHWPSRWGGEEKSRPLRIKAAELCRSITDSLFNINANARIIIMGDLNDDPADVSIKDFLHTGNDIGSLKRNEFYNPYEVMHKPDSIGSLMYRGKWNLFDQILLSHSLTEEKSASFTFQDAKIFKEDYLIQQEGKFKGSPFRTYSYDQYISGYSDHLPVYVYLIRE